MGESLRWREATREALYGMDGFYRRQRPDAHFATSASSGGAFAEAVLRLLRLVDAELGHPDVFTVVDVGAGSGELLSTVLALSTGAVDNPVDELVDNAFAERLRPVGVELRPRPQGLDPHVGWTDVPPGRVTGAVLACEWLDNVPVDVAVVDDEGVVRAELVDPATGEVSHGPELRDDWLDVWWPLREPGDRAELGRPRDKAWAGLVSTLEKGLALAVDYGHTRTHRPPYGTLTGFAGGREVPPVPDGGCDITAHVAMDAVGAAGVGAGAKATRLVRQRQALRELGLCADRPPYELSRTDPRAYMRALARAGEIGALTDPYGLGGHWWLMQRVG